MIPTSLIVTLLIAVSIMLCSIILAIAAEAQLQRKKRYSKKHGNRHTKIVQLTR